MNLTRTESQNRAAMFEDLNTSVQKGTDVEIQNFN